MALIAMTDTPKVYRLLLDLAQRGGKYSAGQLTELAQEAEGFVGFAEQTSFDAAVERVRVAAIAGDNELLVEELIHLRISAMNVVADFDNLVDSISMLFQLDAV